MNTFVIAEAGSNHNKNFDQALKLIDAAKEAGTNAVKFQTFSSKTISLLATLLQSLHCGIMLSADIGLLGSM